MASIGDANATPPRHRRDANATREERRSGAGHLNAIFVSPYSLSYVKPLRGNFSYERTMGGSKKLKLFYLAIAAPRRVYCELNY